MSEFRLTCCTPCFGRPLRTIRLLECLLNQDTNGWEALFIGDGCQVFEKMMDDRTFMKYSDMALKKGNEIHFMNLKEHKGGWGYAARNIGFKLARGKFFVFTDNDDVIMKNHFSNYLSEIEGSGYDLVYFDSYIEPIEKKRETHLSFGNIGHSEIILRTELLKGFEQKPEYGQDWHLIEHLLRKGIVTKKSTKNPTYIVKEIGGGDPNRERLYEKDID